MNAKFDLQDLQRFASKAKRFTDKLKKEISKDLAEAAINIDRKAKMKVPVDKGFLKNSMFFEKRSGGLIWTIGNRMPYAPYQEFGTGRRVDLTELKKAGLPASYAAKFRGKGIRQVNIKPQPFLFPSVNEELPKLKKRMIQTIQRNGRTF